MSDAVRSEFNTAMRDERGSDRERREERRKTIAVTGTPAVAVAPSSFSHLSSLDRGVSHLSLQC
jgi:hypothetical protein